MTIPSHADIADRIEQGNRKFVEIEKALKNIAEKLEPIGQMQADIAATKEIVEAWGAVKSFGKFLKWVGSISAAISAIIVAVKVGASQLLR